MPADRVRTFTRFAWLTLTVTVVVIVWGAVVRATGSGAGCGSHWPLCNGVAIPLAPRAATVIEFTHRLTSGLSLLLTVALVIFAWRLFPAGHPARRWSVWALLFMIGEAAIGAGIVLLQLVENNASAMRAGYVAVHLTNTMLLVAALTLTAHEGQRAEGKGQREVEGRRAKIRTPQAVALALMVFVAAAGAIVALGDTLFPSVSLKEGFAADLNPTSHFLIRLRVWHPILAATAGLLTVFAYRSSLILTLVLLQAGLGVLNLMMLAPLWLQMVHLAGSNVLWIAMVRQTIANAANDANDRKL